MDSSVASGVFVAQWSVCSPMGYLQPNGIFVAQWNICGPMENLQPNGVCVARMDPLWPNGLLMVQWRNFVAHGENFLLSTGVFVAQ